MVIQRITLILLAAILTTLPASDSGSQEMPEQRIYVPNVTGDLSSEKIGDVLASKVSAELTKSGIQAYSERDLRDLLREERIKVTLTCDDETSCLNEIVASYGLARRLFIRVTKLGSNKYEVELALAYRDRIETKDSRTITCSEEDLLVEVPALAQDMMGVAKRGPGGSGGSGQTGVTPIGGGGSGPMVVVDDTVLVKFESNPPGAVVLVDGNVTCTDTSKLCSRELTKGRHKVEMQKDRYITRSEYVEVSSKKTVKWELSPNFGVIEVKSTSTVARVTVDGKVLAGGSGVLEVEPDRKHTVLIDDPCFEATGAEVTVKRGERVKVPLNAVERKAVVKVSAADSDGNALEAEVFVDGRKVGETPKAFTVGLCSKEVEVKTGRQAWESPLQLREGEVTVVQAKFKAEASGQAAVEPQTSWSIVISSDRTTGIEWVTIPGGSFEMGSNEGFSDEKPVHTVKVDTFEMAKTEVTVAQYRKCVDAGVCTPPNTGGDCNWSKLDRSEHPVNCVDWNQATTYAKWAGGRLPTEAEWEYAARGRGQNRKYPWGDEAADCSLVVMYEGGDGCGRKSTWPVCSKTEGNTDQGLCDMAGNVWEWCGDWYEDKYYGNSPSNNPRGPASGSVRAYRGGGWHYDASRVRSSIRDRSIPAGRNDFLGFRVSRSK